MKPDNIKTTAELVAHLGAESEAHMLRFVIGAIGSHGQFLDDKGGYWFRPDKQQGTWEFRPSEDNVRAGP